jgi:hypothetical protein
MSADQLFTAFNNAVLAPWLLLAIAPRWVWTQRIVQALFIPALLGVGYLGAFALAGGLPEGSGFGSLEGVMQAFQQPWVMLAGWVHYLAFDLFVGCWEVRDAQRLGIPHLLVVPCLLLTLMLGPIGLLLYAAIRAGMRRSLSYEPSPR